MRDAAQRRAPPPTPALRWGSVRRLVRREVRRAVAACTSTGCADQPPASEDTEPRTVNSGPQAQDNNSSSGDGDTQRRSDTNTARIGDNAKQRRSARRAARWHQRDASHGATPQGGPQLAAVASASSASAGTPARRLPPGLVVDRPHDATVGGAKRPRVGLTVDPTPAPEPTAISPQLAAASAASAESAEAHQIIQSSSMAATGAEAEARRAARTDHGKRQAVPVAAAEAADIVPRASIRALAAAAQPVIPAPTARGGPVRATSSRRAARTHDPYARCRPAPTASPCAP